MRTDTLVLAGLLCLGLAACVTDSKEWMKVDQKYTTAEFHRDYRECIKDGKPDEGCMRQRGWVPVNPSKSEGPATPEPTMLQRRGRY